MRETIIEVQTAFLASLAALLLLPSACGPAKPTVNGNDAVVEGCGDGVAVGWEECDLGDLRGADCTTLGLAGGTLSCGPSCAYDTSGCHGCGNGLCDAGEDRSSCPEDCGARQVTGGQLGIGQTFNGSHDPMEALVPVPSRDLEAGEFHNCVATLDGRVFCWGDNSNGAVDPVAHEGERHLPGEVSIPPE